jgi:hypothetical protein
MDRPRASHLEHHRAKLLAAQVDRWQRAKAIRAYCDSIEATQPMTLRQPSGSHGHRLMQTISIRR